MQSMELVNSGNSELKRNKKVLELNKMRDIKKIFDPQNILNPGKIF